jgi:hypothetical protein
VTRVFAATDSGSVSENIAWGPSDLNDSSALAPSFLPKTLVFSDPSDAFASETVASYDLTASPASLRSGGPFASLLFLPSPALPPARSPSCASHADGFFSQFSPWDRPIDSGTRRRTGNETHGASGIALPSSPNGVGSDEGAEPLLLIILSVVGVVLVVGALVFVILYRRLSARQKSMNGSLSDDSPPMVEFCSDGGLTDEGLTQTLSVMDDVWVTSACPTAGIVPVMTYNE